MTYQPLNPLQVHRALQVEISHPSGTSIRLTEPAAAVRDRSAIALGRDQDGCLVDLPLKARLEHMLIIGTTGGGKTKLMEHLFLKDHARGYGGLVIDPHGEHPGSFYRSALARLDKQGRTGRTIEIIDPNADSHTVGFNPLANLQGTDISVIVGTTLEAFARVWGDEDTSKKPTIERLLTTAFGALAELGLTLVEAPMLLDRKDRHGLRAFALKTVKDRYTRNELERLHELSLDERRRADFDIETVGPVNRLARLLRPPALRSMLGQSDRQLDFLEAMDQGHTILCNLSGGDRVHSADADLLGRLLLRSLFFHAKRRRTNRPFFVYLDECHRYLSGDLESILAEVRKYGIGIILGHQWQEQMAVQSDNMLAAARNATNIKVVFRLKDPVEAEQLAHAVIPLNLETPIQALIKPAVVGHKRTLLANESNSEQSTKSENVSRTVGVTETETDTFSVGGSETDANNWTNATGTSGSSTTGHSAAVGAASSRGSSSSTASLPNTELLSPPQPISDTRASSTSIDRSASSTSSDAETNGWSQSRSRGGSHSVGVNWSEGRSLARSLSESITVGRGTSHSRGHSTGRSEAFEPIMANLPSAVHSKDAMLYQAGQLLRSLPTGQAVINYVGAAGMVSTLLKVAPVHGLVLSPLAFAALRKRFLEASSSSIAMKEALETIAQRERAFLVPSAADDDNEPTSFRTMAPPSAAKRARTPSDASGRRHPPPDSKRKLSGR